MRSNKLKLVISCFIAVLIILIACIVIIVVGKNTLDRQSLEINELQYEIDANKQVVYVAMADISAGETLKDGTNIMKQEIFTGLEEDYYMTDDMVGMMATLDIKALQPILKDMVAESNITKDIREYEIAVANLMTDQKEYDYVDVRIMFPTGEDYTVLSKKVVKNLNMDSCLFFANLNEDEILRIASATIDAYTVTGTYIYTVRYVEPSLQEESVPNYVVRAEVIDLINSDPNILSVAKETLNLDARINLEGRLRGLTEDALSAVAKGHDIADVAKSKAMLDVEYEASKEDYVYEAENIVSEDALSTEE